MKKILAMLLVIISLFSLCACESNEPKEEKKTEALTLENMDSYLSIDAQIDSCNMKYGYGDGMVGGATGSAEVLIEVKNTSGVKFKNATITCKVTVAGDYSGYGSLYGWEFASGNKHLADETTKVLYEGAAATNYKIVEINLPYDGGDEHEEKLMFTIYKLENESDPLWEVNDGYLEFEITDVEGTVIVEE